MAVESAATIALEMPDGSKREVPSGTTAADVAAQISRSLAKKAVAARLDGKTIDLFRPLTADGKFAIVTQDDPEALEILRHSSAHLMANAVQRLYPGAKVTIGPVTADGFFYDFDYERAFTPEDLEKIEAEMRKLSQADIKVSREVVPPDQTPAKMAEFEQHGEPYKAEILRDILAADPQATISIYHQGDWSDLCVGPHVPTTGLIKHFKLLNAAGAYWRGNEKNKMLTRIYGTAYFTEADLKAHLTRLEEAAKRDHRKLGKELELFTIPEVTGPGLIFWLPKGALIRSIIEDWLRSELKKRGYEQVYTPHVVKETLFEVSGHLGNYAENMFPAMDVEGANYRLKPMNCPGHSMIYKSKPHSYRDLPLRLQEIANVYRYERSGTLHGLARVRGLTMDDAHIFCTLEQLPDEIAGCVEFIQDATKIFGLEAKVYLSTKPEKAIGSDEFWDTATNALRTALERKGMAYDIDEGGGAFYGPKIDFKFYDAIGREWQGPTVQCDPNLPERFDLTYRGSDGQEHRPIMVHRAILGTFERFMALIIEHYAGHFPLWLAPVQAVVIPINEENDAYCREVVERLRSAGLRVELDNRNESLNYRIREAQVQKVPYMLVVGKKEVEQGTLAVRQRTGRQEVLSVQDVIDRLVQEVETKALPQAAAEAVAQ
ncbi:MAG TPA: threonine--tRNA ligase [Stenomitos sp.]